MSQKNYNQPDPKPDATPPSDGDGTNPPTGPAPRC